MSDISCRVFEFFERNAETYGYTLDELVDGVGAELSVLQDPAQRVSWEVWAKLSERFEALVGDPELTRRAGEQIINLDMASPVRTIGGALLAPERVYEAVVRWLGPYLFRNLAWSLDKLGDGHFVLEISIPDGQPASPAWFRMAHGAFVTVPEAVAAGRAVVSPDIDGNRARFEIRCATKTTFLSRAQVWLRTVFRPGRLLAHLSELQTDLRAALSQSLASQQELRRVLTSVPDPVAVVVQGQLLWTNAAWAKGLGDRLPVDLDAEVSAKIVRVDNGEHRAFELAQPVPIAWAGTQAQLVLLRDVTQIRQAAEHMRIADRLGALGMIAASVGHEINNPLSVALGSLEMGLDRAAETKDLEMSKNLRRAIEAISQAAGVTADLLTVAKDSADYEPTQVGEVVNIALRLGRNELRHVAGLDLSVAIDDNLPLVNVSRQRLTQVLLNLVVNAAHAVADAPAPHKIAVRVGRLPDHVSIEVEDSGEGIPAAVLANVKDPFFTTKGHRGSGLGLAVCDRIVSEHGGTLELQSLPGAGTVARVQLPVVGGSRPAVEAPVASPMEPLGELRLLVVDDEPELCAVVANLLQEHELVSVHTRQAAREEVARDPAFDVLLVDVMLLGDSGLDLHGELPAELQRRVVFMTGGVFLQSGQEALAKLDRPLVSKPFTRAQLLRVIASVVGSERDVQNSA